MKQKYACTSNSVIQRLPLIPPMFTQLSPVIRDRLSKIAGVLYTLRPIKSTLLLECTPSELTVFEHGLSGHFEEINTSRMSVTRSPSEFDALGVWRVDAAHMEDSASFVAALTRLNRIFVGERSTVRSGHIRTVSDKNGVSIQFPALKDLDLQISWLRRGINDEKNKDIQLLYAIASLPILTNSHLFVDGNGRVSRVVFNHILHRIGLPSNVYLPVYDIMMLSQGGFLIRLRQAEIQNSWEPFISFMLDFIDFCRSMTKNHMRQS